MAKEEIVILGVIILVCISLFFVSSVPEDNKITPEVYEKLAGNSEEIPVVVKINPKKEFLGIIGKSLDETKEDIVNNLEDKTYKGDKDLISLEISKQELEQLAKRKEVESISYAHSFSAFLQDSAPLVNATNSWASQIYGTNISGIDETVCVIDTGINFSHPDLVGKNKTNCLIYCFGGVSCFENCTATDDEGHGTHTAGIIAANGGIKGVAKGTSLIGIKALNSSGDGDYLTATTDLKNSIDWFVENRNLYNISSISMSLGTITLYPSYCDASFPTTLTPAINNATYYNLSVVVASGNNGDYTKIAAPACIRNSIAVGANSKGDDIASYSNRNNITDLVAPGGILGDRINSTKSVGGYEERYGTSMAAPHVAGAFAMINHFSRLQSNRKRTVEEIVNALNSTGKQIYDSSSGLYFSRIDVYSAIISLDSIPPNVTLISPQSNIANQSNDYTFRCNTTDYLELKNITLQIWNSGSLYYENTRVISGKFAQAEWNISNLPINSYQWNCLAYDQNNNRAYSLTNRTLQVTSIGPQMMVIGVDGFQYNHYVNMLIAGQLGNFTRLIRNGGWNGTLNITGHANTETAPGNAELATGLNETLNRVSNNSGLQSAPNGNTTFERLESFNSSIVTGCIYGKNRNYIFAIYSNSWQDVDWWQNSSTYSPSAWPNGSGYDNSMNVATKATEFIGNYSNQSFYLFVYFGVPDGSGHLSGDNSTDYNLSIINVDSGLGLLLNSLENNGINESVQIIITADHGWNLGTKGHGTPNSDTIVLPLITNNYSMISYNTSDGIREQCEVAPTTLNYFGLPRSSYQEIINNGCESMIERETSPPGITINSPLNQTYSSAIVNFNISSDENLSYCLFTTNNWTTNYSLSIAAGKREAVYTNSSMENGNYLVIFWCNDTNSNINNTEKINFSVLVSVQEDNPISSSGGGGGSSSLYKTYEPNENKILEGYSQQLAKNDRIKFSILEKEHIVIVNEIKENYINITVSSNPIKLILKIGEGLKLNLTSLDRYDLYIKVNSITSNKANLTIKKIYEEIPIIHFQEPKPIENTPSKDETATPFRISANQEAEEVPNNYAIIIIEIILSTLIVIAAIFFIAEIIKRKMRIKELRKKRIALTKK